MHTRAVAPDVARGLALCFIAIANVMLYPLFALLLGYGVARSGARDSGVAGTPRLRRRGLGLVLFGAVHGVLLFSGDILGLYGILTILLIRALCWPDRRLLIVAAVLIVPCALVQGIAFAEPGTTLQLMVPLLAAWALGGGGWLSSVGALLFGLAVYPSTACVALWSARLGTRGPAEHLLRRFADGGAQLTITTK